MAKVEYRFDPFELVGADKSEFTKSQIQEVYDRAKGLVLESVLTDMGQGRSSVDGQRWKKLDRKYASKKRAEGGTGSANLEMSGSLKESIRVKKSGDELVLTTTASKQAVADGHNNFSGESNLPERKFIPNEDNGETLRSGIRADLKAIIRDVSDG